MKGIVVQFRRGRKRIHERHFLLDLDFKDREEAKKAEGKDVEWKTSSGKIIKGKISKAHGNNGLVRAIFEKGLPGQAITDEVELKGEMPKDEKKEEKGKEKKIEKKENKKKAVIKEKRDDDKKEADKVGGEK
jgi:large subunit ribosomal protein L35Ae